MSMYFDSEHIGGKVKSLPHYTTVM